MRLQDSVFGVRTGKVYGVSVTEVWGFRKEVGYAFDNPAAIAAPPKPVEGKYQAARKRGFKLPWRKAVLLNFI